MWLVVDCSWNKSTSTRPWFVVTTTTTTTATKRDTNKRIDEKMLPSTLEANTSTKIKPTFRSSAIEAAWWSIVLETSRHPLIALTSRPPQDPQVTKNETFSTFHISLLLQILILFGLSCWIVPLWSLESVWGWSYVSISRHNRWWRLVETPLWEESMPLSYPVTV